jgi:hypothetical protein
MSPRCHSYIHLDDCRDSSRAPIPTEGIESAGSWPPLPINTVEQQLLVRLQHVGDLIEYFLNARRHFLPRPEPTMTLRRNYTTAQP